MLTNNEFNKIAYDRNLVPMVYTDGRVQVLAFQVEDTVILHSPTYMGSITNAHEVPRGCWAVRDPALGIKVIGNQKFHELYTLIQHEPIRKSGIDTQGR